MDFAARSAGAQPALLTCPVRPVTDAAIARLWARQKLAHLLDEGRAAEAIALSVRANLICSHTAFVAWDETERIAVPSANREVYQPAMEIEGADFAMCADMSLYAPRRRAADFAPPAVASAMMRSVCREAPALLSLRCLDDFESEDEGASPPGSRPDDGWRRDLERVLPPASTALLDRLGDWLLSDPARQPARRLLLEELADLLKHSREPVATLRQWIETNLTPPFRAPVLCEFAAIALALVAR